MTRFRNKIIWFWDFIDCEMKVVLVHRVYDEPWKVMLRFGTPDSISLSTLGEVVFNGEYESKVCTYSSWFQIISRYFPKTRYNKSGELYVYDTKDSL